MHPRSVTIDEIARAVSLSESHLWALGRNMDRAFCPTRRKNVRGKVREIDAPKRMTRRILRRLHRFFQRKLRAHSSVHGGARSRSCFTAARKHMGRRYVVTRDIKNAYPSITQGALKHRLLRLGFRSDVALLLSLLLTVKGRLAQGSPVSSDALNFFLFDADRALSAACGKRGANYSRTYDDMVISVNSPRTAEWPGIAMRRQIENHGLQINLKKHREGGFQPSHYEQRVHSIVVNNKRGLRINGMQARHAVELAQSYIRSAKVVSHNSLEALAFKRSQVTGWMHYCRQAEFGPARHIRRLLDSGDRHVERALTEVGLIPYRNKWWLVSQVRNEPRRLTNAWRSKIRKSAA